ncbi:abortive infection family protein [Acidovorax sp. HMWF018]|uniref:abortive infection family protein n=1 Tax=Acidovorax sp. HMWF018 TaxID=2056855 RepID=UPI001E299D15|nr:abortive infection family protein [Acidovorax sp. HMWF018]
MSAAANILEAIFKTYIEDNGLTMPDKQDLQPVFKVVRAHLGLDPSSIEDNDLQRIITGLFSVVDGIGALRTHASSAHSEGRKSYRLEPRHARLAVNGAHTVATFVMETWDKKAGS